MQVGNNVSLKRKEMKGVPPVWFSGETGMVLTWITARQGRILRDGVQGTLAQGERLIGNSSFCISVALRDDGTRVVSQVPISVYGMKL